MVGLVPAIHKFAGLVVSGVWAVSLNALEVEATNKTWMAGTSPAMTAMVCDKVPLADSPPYFATFSSPPM